MGLTFDPPDASKIEIAQPQRTNGGNSYSAIRLANKTTVISVTPTAGEDVIITLPPASSIDPIAKEIDWGRIADLVIDMAKTVADVVDAILPDGGDGSTGGGNAGGGGKGGDCVEIGTVNGNVNINMGGGKPPQ